MEKETKEMLIQTAKDFDIYTPGLEKILEIRPISKQIEIYLKENQSFDSFQLFKLLNTLSGYDSANIENGIFICPTCGLRHKDLNDLYFNYKVGSEPTNNIGCKICLFFKNLDKSYNIEPLQEAIYKYSNGNEIKYIGGLLTESIENQDDEGVLCCESNLQYYYQIQDLFRLAFKRNQEEIFKGLNDLILKYNAPIVKNENIIYETNFV